jgi:hypothetical protein
MGPGFEHLTDISHFFKTPPTSLTDTATLSMLLGAPTASFKSSMATTRSRWSVESSSGLRDWSSDSPISPQVLNCADFEWAPYSAGADIILTDPYPLHLNASFSSVYNTACNSTFGCCGESLSFPVGRKLTFLGEQVATTASARSTTSPIASTHPSSDESTADANAT